MKKIRMLGWVSSAILLSSAATGFADQKVTATNDSYVSSANPNTGYGPDFGFTLFAPQYWRLYQFPPPALPAGQEVTPLSASITEQLEDQEPVGATGMVTLMGTPQAPGATYNQVFSTTLLTLGSATYVVNPDLTITYTGLGVYTGLMDTYSGAIKSFVLPYISAAGFIQTEEDGVPNGDAEYLVFKTDAIVPEPSTWGIVAGEVALLGGYLWQRRRA